MRNIVLILLVIGNFGCVRHIETITENSAKTYLWEDQTAKYLPKTAEWTNRVEVADINGDNRVDLIFANGGNYSAPGEPEPCRIFLNQGPDSLFKEITTDVFGTKRFISRAVKARDINNDEITDIIVSTTYQSQSQLFIGLGDGQFQDVTSEQFPSKHASIGDLELGDVDQDGDLDLVLADWGEGSNMNNSGGRTMLWLNDGKGKFSDATEERMPELLIQFSWDLEFVDFDNDFDLDIAISCKRCPTSRIFVNDGKGYYTDQRLLPAYTNNYELEPMDVNGDGYLDLLTVNDGEIVDQVSYSRREHIFLNDSGRKFLDATSLLWPDTENPGEDDNNISFLDFDSDGDPDFIISSLTGEDRLLINQGDGSFRLKQPVLSGSATPLTLSIIVADINGDHVLDVVMGQGEGSAGIKERIYIGTGSADTAQPIISHVSSFFNENNELIVKARIHDNKSPNMPHDWAGIAFQVGNDSASYPMKWYGENLWVGKLPTSVNNQLSVTITATDKAGNEAKHTFTTE